jgi:hypothetical protein
MISGYNTDVRHQDIVFHVQTEDKGAGNPLIESLVYVGGQVLAAKRASYADMWADGQGREAVAHMMETQHRRVIAAIRAGKFSDKVESLLGIPQPRPTAAGTAAVPVPTPTGELLVADTQAGDQDRTLDQVILDYLTSEADQEQLVVEVQGEPELVVGQPAQLHMRAISSKASRPLSGVEFRIRMISTVAEGRTLAVAHSDAKGEVVMPFKIPSIGTGTAALIIIAESQFGTVELKHLL